MFSPRRRSRCRISRCCRRRPTRRSRPRALGCPQGTREPSQARSVEAARTPSAVRGDQDHEDRHHYQRQTYSQPGLPVPLGPSVAPARLVHLEPPYQGLFRLHEDVPMGPPMSSPLAAISPPGRPDVRPGGRRRRGTSLLRYPPGARSFGARPHGLGATARPYSGAAPAWRTPTSSRWRRRSAGSS